MFAYLMFIAGAIFFVRGILEMVTTASPPDWFLFFPYCISSEPYSILGLALTLRGIALLVYGLGMGLYCAHDRAWYIQDSIKPHPSKRAR